MHRHGHCWQFIPFLSLSHAPLLYWDSRRYTQAPHSFYFLFKDLWCMKQTVNRYTQSAYLTFNTKNTEVKEVKTAQKQVAVGLQKLVITVGVDETVSNCEGCLSLKIALHIFSTSSWLWMHLSLAATCRKSLMKYLSRYLLTYQQVSSLTGCSALSSVYLAREYKILAYYSLYKCKLLKNLLL